MFGLVTQFAPLIRKYGAKLRTEDGLYDLRADFIDLIRNVDITQIHNDKDPGIIRYLETALRRCFIKRLARAKAQDVPSISLDDMEDWRRDRIPQLAARDSYFETEFLQTDGLTEKERLVLALIYQYGFSSAEVARKVHTTRKCKPDQKACGKEGLGKIRRRRAGMRLLMLALLKIFRGAVYICPSAFPFLQ